jgi:hypothetical protein
VDPIALSRIQFAFTKAYHLSLRRSPWAWRSCWFCAGQALWHHDEIAQHAVHFWSRLFNVTFVMGVVTGIPLEFQFVSNWSQFSPDVLQTLNAAGEVQIEPRSVDGRSGQLVTIWVIVVDGDVYVRSYKGPQGRWYQALLARPEGVLHADGQCRSDCGQRRRPTCCAMAPCRRR